MPKPLRIPLFPLEVVLFPGMTLPLHIFEPRYKEMTRRCVDEHIQFGVVLAHSEGIASVGCTAEINRIVREYPDGRMDILATGRSVFAIQQVLEEKSYLEADIEYRIDDPTPGPPELQAELVRLVQAARKVVQAEGQIEPHTEVPLSYQILALLPLDLEMKQKMLEMESEIERRQKLRRLLKRWLPQFGHTERVRRKAHGNGHGLS